MAIIFVSPKKRQRTLFLILSIALLSILIAISLVFFIPGFLKRLQSPPTALLFESPDITINLDILNSNKVKNLEPFGDLKTAYIYMVEGKDGKQVTGSISMDTKEQAQKILEDDGFKIISLEELNIGRDNPFVSY